MMDKLTALNEVRALIEKGALKFSDYDMIENVVTKEDTSPASMENAKRILYQLVDDGLLSTEVFDTLKPFLKVNTVASTPAPTPTFQQTHTNSEDEGKSLHGFGIGFVFGFFLNLIGLILGLVLGDSKCKKGTLTGFLINLGIGIIGLIIYFVVIAGVVSAAGGMYY